MRRIEAITGRAAVEHLRERAVEADGLEREVAELRAQLKKAAAVGRRRLRGNGHDAALLDSAGEEGGIRIAGRGGRGRRRRRAAGRYPTG